MFYFINHLYCLPFRGVKKAKKKGIEHVIVVVQKKKEHVIVIPTVN